MVKKSAPVKLVFPTLAILLISAVIVAYWGAEQSDRGDAPPLLGPYRLTQVATGPQAVSQMSRLHGKGVGVVDGDIAYYTGLSASLVAYVAKVASPSDATLLNKQMENRIAQGNPYFTDLRPVKVDGTRVLSVKAGPETHYFWAVGSRVIWLGFDKDDPAVLHAAVKAFK